jgi:hypothetical protein
MPDGSAFGTAILQMNVRLLSFVPAFRYIQHVNVVQTSDNTVLVGEIVSRDSQRLKFVAVDAAFFDFETLFAGSSMSESH